MGEIDRRTFIRSAGAGLLVTLGAAPSAAAASASPQLGSNHVLSATAITKVFGDGQKLVAVALLYDTEMRGAALSTASYSVADRTVVGVHTADEPTAKRSPTGRWVVVDLSPSDPAASLYVMLPNSGPGGPPTVGQDTPGNEILPAHVSITQQKPVVTRQGAVYAADGTSLSTGRVINPIVDEFRQHSFTDPITGRSLAYNLYTPRGYDPNRKYPLVLFMHDAGPVNVGPTAPLVQGLGAVCWASPEDQAKHECFVVAPEFPEIVIDNNYQPSTYFQAAVHLVGWLAGEYSIDRRRMHTTGQSMGAMLSLGMDIYYPGLFASSLIVAGQWPAAQAKALAKKRMWVVVSEDDDYAFPTENAQMAVYRQAGTKITQAEWNGRATQAQSAAAVRHMEAGRTSINYATFAPGTVEPRGATGPQASGHENTWRIAYTIPGIREWIMQPAGM